MAKRRKPRTLTLTVDDKRKDITLFPSGKITESVELPSGKRMLEIGWRGDPVEPADDAAVLHVFLGSQVRDLESKRYSPVELMRLWRDRLDWLLPDPRDGRGASAR